ncbi:hypothetical protein BDV29DRAFT_157506 [Aspergillus leporis]|uniref:Uncharacterized protein n=1 Tax=Aspergillus leporis TaxID=41062 RepID=A0A5N5X214_9EURO|nr:hypothetical protein BDV29DRAFT_157506 [Aspergillus leporis]
MQMRKSLNSLPVVDLGADTPYCGAQKFQGPRWIATGGYEWYLMGPTEDDGLNLLVRAACRRNSDDVDDALWEEARKYSKSDPFAKLPVELLHGIPPVLQAFLSAQS